VRVVEPIDCDTFSGKDPEVRSGVRGDGERLVEIGDRGRPMLHVAPATRCAVAQLVCVERRVAARYSRWRRHNFAREDAERLAEIAVCVLDAPRWGTETSYACSSDLKDVERDAGVHAQGRSSITAACGAFELREVRRRAERLELAELLSHVATRRGEVREEALVGQRAHEHRALNVIRRDVGRGEVEHEEALGLGRLLEAHERVAEEDARAAGETLELRAASALRVDVDRVGHRFSGYSGRSTTFPASS
jgi:hypothetical protein